MHYLNWGIAAIEEKYKSIDNVNISNNIFKEVVPQSVEDVNEL